MPKSRAVAQKSNAARIAHFFGKPLQPLAVWAIAEDDETCIFMEYSDQFEMPNDFVNCLAMFQRPGYGDDLGVARQLEMRTPLPGRSGGLWRCQNPRSDHRNGRGSRFI